MSTWAYECRAREDSAARWFVSRLAIDELPTDTRSVLVRVGDDWVPAIVDRSRQIAVEAMLLHEVIADDEYLDSDVEVSSPDRIEGADSRHIGAGVPTPGQTVTAAAISVAGMKFVVVLVDRTVATGPGEADLVVADMQSRFGVPVVLMGQEEDATPVYYGSQELKDRVAGLPVDRLPWKEYALG